MYPLSPCLVGEDVIFLDVCIHEKVRNLCTRHVISCVIRLFPPPVFDRFQHEVRWGKVWEIRSRAVPSGRHMVDTRRAVPKQECRRPVLYCPSNGWMSEHSSGSRSIPFVVHNGWDGSTQNSWSPPPVCLPSVYETSCVVLSIQWLDVRAFVRQ